MSMVIELRGAKKIKMLRMMLNFTKDNLKESEQITQSILKIKMGESKSRKEKRVGRGGEGVNQFLDVVWNQ